MRSPLAWTLELAGLNGSETEKVVIAIQADARADLERENAELKKALIDWRDYFQSTNIDPEQQGEDFTSAWIAMEQALKMSVNKNTKPNHEKTV